MKRLFALLPVALAFILVPLAASAPAVNSLYILDDDQPTQPQNVVIDDDGSGDETSRFVFTATDVTRTDCAVDDGAFVRCSSGYKLSVPVGTHTAHVIPRKKGVIGPVKSVTFTVSAPAPPAPQCSDGVNNDPSEDNLIDLADPGCSSASDNTELGNPPPTAQCADGINNDPSEDSLVDLADPGCTDASDNSELGNPPPAAQCSDTLDNDSDGLVDLSDPGCADAQDNDETNSPPPVNNCTHIMAAGGNPDTFAESLPQGAVGCVPGGTYTSSFSWSRDYGARTTLKPLPGDTVIFQDIGVFLAGDFQRFEGFIVDHRCPRIAAGDGPCPVVGADLDGIRVTGLDVEVVGNTVRNISRNGIILGSVALRSLVERNFVISVGANTSHSGNRDHGVYMQGSNHRVLRNVLVTESGYGVKTHDPGATNSLVAGNTAVNCLPFFNYTASEPCTAVEKGITVSGSGNVVVNNIFDGGRLAGSGYIFDNNANLQTSWSVDNGTPPATNTIPGQPVFADDMLRLALGSPGIDQARTDHVYWPDFDGAVGALGAGPDVGAYER